MTYQTHNFILNKYYCLEFISCCILPIALKSKLVYRMMNQPTNPKMKMLWRELLSQLKFKLIKTNYIYFIASLDLCIYCIFYLSVNDSPGNWPFLCCHALSVLTFHPSWKSEKSQLAKRPQSCNIFIIQFNSL